MVNSCYTNGQNAIVAWSFKGLGQTFWRLHKLTLVYAPTGLPHGTKCKLRWKIFDELHHSHFLFTCMDTQFVRLLIFNFYSFHDNIVKPNNMKQTHTSTWLRCNASKHTILPIHNFLVFYYHRPAEMQSMTKQINRWTNTHTCVCLPVFTQGLHKAIDISGLKFTYRGCTGYDGIDFLQRIKSRSVVWECGVEYVTSGSGKTSAPNSEKAFNHRNRLDSSVAANWRATRSHNPHNIIYLDYSNNIGMIACH